jgi:trans-2,3-dihydro-3-hydroxyanthranilate isomerase
MRVDFRLVDVFAEEPFGGNQLCVVPEPPAGLDDITMQALAREIGFSETTFVTATTPTGYDIRIFTPENELPFAGHPTLGTAFTLVREGLTGAETVQHCGAGDIPVRIRLEQGDGTMRQLPPVVGPEVVDRSAVAAAAGLDVGDLLGGTPILPISTGIPHLMVPVAHDVALRRATRDERGCHDVCEAAEAESLYLFAVRGPGDVRARMFDRFPTIGEDPATGSAAGPLLALLHARAGVERVDVAQGVRMGRPSAIACAVEGERIRVAGDTVVLAEGVVRL